MPFCLLDAVRVDDPWPFCDLILALASFGCCIDTLSPQPVNCSICFCMGRSGLINSGGASSGESDLKEAVKTAVINKRAGGTGLISGRKAFQRPMPEGIALLNAIQDVYLDKSVTIA